MSSNNNFATELTKTIVNSVLVICVMLAGYMFTTGEMAKRDHELAENKKALADSKKHIIGGDPSYYVMIAELAEEHIVLTCRPTEDHTDFEIIGVNHFGKMRGLEIGDTVFHHVPEFVEQKHAPILSSYERGEEFEIHDMGEQFTEWTDEAGRSDARIQVFDTPADVIQIHVHLEMPKK